MKEYTVPKKTLWLWQIRISILALILLFISIMLTKATKICLILACLILLLFLLIIFCYLPILFKTCRCKVVNDTVVLRIGVFFKSIHVFPMLRLIYSQTITTPLAKKFGLCGVSLKAARNRIFIPELTKNDAEELMNMITRSGADEI